MSSAFQSCLGETRPINLLQEYLAIFRGRQKSKAYILSWLDNWLFNKKRAGKPPWVYIVLQNVAADLGYCRDTVHRHLKELVEMGLLSRRPYKPWATDNIWEYTINFEELRKWLNQVKSQESKVRSEELIFAESQAISAVSSSFLSPITPNSSPSPNSDSHLSEIRLPAVQVQNTYTNLPQIYPLQKTQQSKSVVVKEKKEEKNIDETNQEELISKDELANALSSLPVRIKPNLNLKKAVEFNFPRFQIALQNLKKAMNSWRVDPAFNWGGLLVKFLREEYDEWDKSTVDFTEEDPPTETDLLALEEAKLAGRILDFYFSSTEKSHRVITSGGSNIHWRSGLNMAAASVGAERVPNLDEILERKQYLWRDVPQMRSAIADWAAKTNGIAITETGPDWDF